MNTCVTCRRSPYRGRPLGYGRFCTLACAAVFANDVVSSAENAPALPATKLVELAAGNARQRRIELKATI